MLKGFVSGEEKDIVRIPMNGRNMMPAGEKKTVSSSGITFESDGEGRYHVYGTATGEATAKFNLARGFITPISVSNGGQGTLSFFNNQKIDKVTFSFNNNKLTVDYWVMSPLQRTNTSYNAIGDRYVDNIMLRVPSGVQVDMLITPEFTNDGVLPTEFTPHYQEGWEVRDNQDRLIWGREDTLEGTDSIPINGYGTPLTSVTIKGNGQQNGTPSLQNIVPFDGTGERTANLYDINAHDTNNGYANDVQLIIDGTTVVWGSAEISEYIPIDGDTSYTFNGIGSYNSPAYCLYDADKQLIGGYTYGGRSIISFTSPNNARYLRFTHIKRATTAMLVEGTYTSSTMPSYEPYGYKIPITCASVTTPLYIGEVSTVRRIRKLVLTGEETFSAPYGNSVFYASSSGIGIAAHIIYEILCTHFTRSETNFVTQMADKKVLLSSTSLYIRMDAATTVSDFKAYLAAQYASGTPVTIWYVLATEQTGIVNEPLMKIGDYADELTTTTPIPTTTGATDVTVDTKIPPSELTIKVHAKKIRYGFKIDKSQENSESAVIYTHDAVTMTPAVMDFTNDRFSYGSWENAWFVRDARPCALKLDGTVAYYLDPNDATKKLDGTASDIYYELLSTEPADWSTQWKQYYTKSGDDYTLNNQAEAPTFATNTYYKLTYNSSFTGNFMVEFPQVWFKRYEDTSYNYIEISNYKLSDDWKCYSHINKDGTLVDRIYLPMFKGVIKDSKLRSLPGQIPQGNTSATTEVNAATALGSRWQIWDHSSVECLNDLLTLMSKSIDSQGKFGKGKESGYNTSDTVTYGKLQTGTLVKKGKFHGYSSSYKEVKVFGMEGFWANRWDRLQGMLLVNNVWKIKMTPPYNFTGTDFVTLSSASVPSGNGYLSKVQTSQYGSIPASIEGGGSSKFYKDYFYKMATDTRVAFRGGSCSHGANCGFRYVIVSDAASHSHWSLGASPVYK